jgi:DNA invertase Pin-like site-specific DNA recombinase
MKGLTLTKKEQTRLYIMNAVLERQWSVGEAAQLLGVSERHTWRLLAAYRKEGAAAILNLVNAFRVCGVQVISYQESWTEVPGEIGEILYAIAGWVARMESQRRSERTKAGLARLKVQGRSLGRPPGSKDRRKRKRRHNQT